VTAPWPLAAAAPSVTLEERFMRTSSRDFAILLFDEVEILDVAAIAQVASSAGRHWNWRPFRLLHVAARPGWIETRNQLRIEAALSLSECTAPELLLIPGGYGARRAASDPVIVEWCRQASTSATLIAAVGSGAAVLGAAGLLEGEELAQPSTDNAWLADAVPGARIAQHRRVVGSGARIVTATDGVDALELGLLIVERTLGKRLSDSLRSKLSFGPETRRVTLSEPSDRGG
jgi:transcriptional regulator GlxA family with amidase domain